MFIYMISLNRRYQSKYFCFFPRTSITDFCYAGYILQWKEQKWTYMEDVWGQSLTWMYLFMLAKINLGSFYVNLSDALHNFIDGLHLLFAIVELILKFETWSFLSPFFVWHRVLPKDTVNRLTKVLLPQVTMS